MKLTEKKIKNLKHIEGRAVGFRIDRIRLPNGKTAEREYLAHPGAVAVVPVLSDGRIVLVRQYRYPVREATIEIPAGKLERGHSPLQTVRRELREETGYTARRFAKILSFWPTAAFANEIIHVYIARGLNPGRPDPDDDEFVEIIRWPLKKALDAIETGKIKDSKTIIGLFMYKNRIRIGKSHWH